MILETRIFVVFLSICIILPTAIQADPEIVIDPEEIEVELVSGDMEELTICITNTGDNDLGFIIEHEIIAEPERDQYLHSARWLDRNDQGGPRRDELGDEIAEYELGEAGWSGLAWDGEFMWGIMGEQGMVAFDPGEEEVVEEVNLNGFHLGLAYDGESFWTGIFVDDDEQAIIQRIDREGNVNRTLNVRGMAVSGVAYDGENLWYYSVNWEDDFSIRQITTGGEQIRTINVGEIFEGSALSLAWVPEHEDGNLWAIAWDDRRIYQLDISGDEPEVLQEERINGDEIFGLEHDDENMWYCTQDDVWRVIDDGIRESNWLMYDPDEGVLDPEEDIDVTLTFDAADLNEGDYEAEIHIISNDPNNEEVNVSVLMRIIGIPDLEVIWEEEIGFPDVINWNEAYIDLFIGEAFPIPVLFKNIGTAEVVVEEVYSNGDVFSANPANFELAPDDEIEVEFILETEESGVYETEMIIVWNSPNEENYTIPMRAAVSDPPVIELEPLEIETDLNTGNIERHDINVSNAGEAVLRFSIDYEVISEPDQERNLHSTLLIDRNEPAGPRRDDLGDIIEEYNIGNEAWSGLAWDGELMWGVSVEGDMVAFDPDAEEIVEEVNLNEEYYCLTYDGGFFWAGSFGGDDEGARIHRIDRNGDINRTIEIQGWLVSGISFDGENLWYYSMDFEREDRVFRQISLEGNQLREIIIEDMFEGMTFSIEWISEHEDGNLWVLDWETRILHQLDVSEDDPELVQQTQVNGIEIFGLAHDDDNMWYCTDGEDWTVIDDGIAELSWLSCDPESGELDPDSDIDITLTINCAGLIEGDYDADIHFTSNDPETPDAIVNFRMHITGAPVIEATWEEDAGYPETVDWNQAFIDVFTGISYPVPVIVKNIGTTDLEVEDIYCENHQVFSSDPIEFVLGPDEEMVVDFIFETEEEDVFESEMIIVWNSINNEDTIIPLVGRTSLPPVIEVDPTEIEVELNIDEYDEQLINIANFGSSILRFEIEYEIISEPDEDRDNPSGPQRDDFGDVLNEFNVLRAPWSGLTWDGEHMWGVTVEEQMAAFDPETEQMIETVNLDEPYHGMTYDGELFWVGTFGGEDAPARILSIDRNGDVSQTINVQGWMVTGVAFDGENLWYYSNNWEQEAVVIRQIAPDGEQLRQVNCSNILRGEWISLAWAPEHSDGNLWAISADNGTTLFQLDVSGDDPEVVQQTQIHESELYGLEHDGENMWYSTTNGFWYVIDDGITEINWLSCDPEDGDLEPNEDLDMVVDLNAIDLSEGEYEADIHVLSNDPNESDLIISVSLVVGASSAPGESVLPDKYNLSAAYPNPFNSSTIIEYQLPHLTNVSLQVYDLHGRLLKTLYSGEKSAGKYSAIWNTDSNPTGIYFISINTPDFKAVRKAILVK